MEVFQDHNTESRPTEASWIRGVNLGGWLVLEPYITPYFFALTTCHLKGDYRFYEGQIDAPSKENPMYKSMDTSKCKPILPYPNDDWTLTKSFPSKDIARGWMETHWDNFVKRDDISKLKKSGITHVRSHGYTALNHFSRMIAHIVVEICLFSYYVFLYNG